MMENEKYLSNFKIAAPCSRLRWLVKSSDSTPCMLNRHYGNGTMGVIVWWVICFKHGCQKVK